MCAQPKTVSIVLENVIFHAYTWSGMVLQIGCTGFVFGVCKCSKDDFFSTDLSLLHCGAECLLRLDGDV